jgi:purine-binding chemotaxis protein CheW
MNRSSAELPQDFAEPTSDGAANSQYLTFVCDGEEYGIDILRVQEIKGWEGVTRLPQAEEYVLGVMNLRGAIVPVVDLRARFALERRTFDASTVVIVVHVSTPQGEKTVGIVVDAVSDVASFSDDAIKPPPTLGGRIDRACVSGLATDEHKMVMLLNVDRLLAVGADGV